MGGPGRRPGGLAFGRSLTTCQDLRIAELRRLYVQESFQGRGVGRQRVETATAEARRQGHDVLYLLTDHYDMEIAAKLYQDGLLGFRV